VLDMQIHENQKNEEERFDSYMCKRGIRAVNNITVPLSTLASMVGVPEELIAGVAGGTATPSNCISLGSILEKSLARKYPGLLRSEKMDDPPYICRIELWKLCDELDVGVEILSKSLNRSLASCKSLLRRSGEPEDLISITRKEFLTLKTKLESTYIRENLPMLENCSLEIQKYLETTSKNTQKIKIMIVNSLDKVISLY
jgi:hypothetical protein